jgi:hypothetical protein
LFAGRPRHTFFRSRARLTGPPVHIHPRLSSPLMAALKGPAAGLGLVQLDSSSRTFDIRWRQRF